MRSAKVVPKTGYPINIVNTIDKHQMLIPERVRSAHFVVPYFLKILNVKKTPLITAIEESVINLDTLAIKIDSKIDQNISAYLFGAKINSFKGLKQEVRNCFDSLKGYPFYDIVIDDTLNAIQLSFNYNTKERSIVYSLTEAESYKRCTTYYLLPLISLLFKLNNSCINIDKIFFLTSNGIQLLDDYVDICSDIDSNNSTPITNRYFELIETQTNEVFSKLSEEVVSKSNYYLSELSWEIAQKSSMPFAEELLSDWYKFNEQFAKMKFLEPDNHNNRVEHLRRVLDVMPPFLSYTGG